MPWSPRIHGSHWDTDQNRSPLWPTNPCLDPTSGSGSWQGLAAGVALLVEGDAGIGKTTVWAAALDLLQGKCRLPTAAPSPSESRSSYAAVADLVGEVFDEARAGLPPAQERALAAALLRSDGADTLDGWAAGTAVLTLLQRLLADAPLVVAIDDVQWLDRASARVVAFVVRRLTPGAFVFSVRGAPGSGAPLELDRVVTPQHLHRVAPGPLPGLPQARPALARRARHLDGHATRGGNAAVVAGRQT